jgi:endonuclease/exonuclease/phosphatase family metal-dependent hydrolase
MRVERLRMALPLGLAVLLLAAEPGFAATTAPDDPGSPAPETADTTTPGATPGAILGNTDRKPGQRRKAAMVKIATYNTASKLRTRRAVRDVRALADRVHILALQEMASPERRSRVRAALVSCKRCEFDAYMPRPAVPGSTPILFRSKRFDLLGAGTRQVTKATRVGARGAGPPTMRAKYVNYVRLRDKVTRRVVVVLNNHAVPSVQARGGAPNTKLHKRLKLYRQHMRGLQRMVTRLRAGGKVFVTGDLNVNYRADRRLTPRLFPYHRLGSLGMRASYHALGEPRAGTHVLRSGNDRRLIDYVYYLPQRSVRPIRQRILRGYASDHRPLLVKFRITRRR